MIDTVRKHLVRDLVKLKPSKSVLVTYELADIDAPALASGTTQPLLDLAAAHDCDVAFNDYYRRAEFRRKMSVT